MISEFNEAPSWAVYNLENEYTKSMASYFDSEDKGLQGPITDDLYISWKMDSVPSPLINEVIQTKTYGFYKFFKIQKNK
jgi:hypothetical protein